MPKSHEFPCYRELSNRMSRYRITAPTAFTEVQHVGRRYIVHEVRASTYPELVRIAELIEAGDGLVHVITQAEFDDWLYKARHRH